MGEKQENFKGFVRLRKPKSESSRPIFARFLRYGDKEQVTDQARKHRRTRTSISTMTSRNCCTTREKDK